MDLLTNLLNVELRFKPVEKMESRQEMSCRSETKDREEIDVKEEFYEISTDGVNYRKIPEKYQTITPSPVQMCCRLCALPNDDMVDIFAADDAEHDMRDKMEYCLRIVVRGNLIIISIIFK